MVDAPPLRRGAPSRVACWARDAATGRISAMDWQGEVLMSIGTQAGFGPRLAAAFGAQAAPRDAGLSASFTRFLPMAVHRQT